MDNLYNRCEDGIGQSCNAYGMALMELDPKGNAKIGMRYVRRACSMAFRPACGKKTRDEKDEKENTRAENSKDCLSTAMKGVTTEPIALPDGSQGQLISAVQKDSVLAQSGLQVGDVILKIGEGPSLAAAGGREPSSGKAGRTMTVPLLEIQRRGLPLSLPVVCK